MPRPSIPAALAAAVVVASVTVAAVAVASYDPVPASAGAPAGVVLGNADERPAPSGPAARGAPQER